MMLLALVLFATLMATWSITPAMCHPDVPPVTAALHASHHVNIHLMPHTHIPVPLSFTNSAPPTLNVLPLSLLKQKSTTYENKKSSMHTSHSLTVSVKSEKLTSHPSVNYSSEELKPHTIINKKMLSLNLSDEEDTKSFKNFYEKNERNGSRYILKMGDVLKNEKGSDSNTVAHTNSEQNKNIPQQGGQNAEELYWIFDASKSSIAEKPPPVELTTSPYPPAPTSFVSPNTKETFRYYRMNRCKEMKTFMDCQQKLVTTAKESQVNSVHDRQPNVNAGSLKSNDMHKRNINIQNILRGHFSSDHNALASGNSVLYGDEGNRVSVDTNTEVNAVKPFDTYTICNEDNSGKCIFKRSVSLLTLENSSLHKDKNNVKKHENLADIAFDTKFSSLESNSMDILQNTSQVNSTNFSINKSNKKGTISFPRYTRYIKNNDYSSSPKSKQQHKRSNSSPKTRQAAGSRGHHRRRRPGRGKRRDRRMKGLSLWIDSKQVKTFSGYVMEIFVIHNSRVLPYILDPNFEGQLPVIPAQVEVVNFTWRAGTKKYLYTFDHMYSHDESLLAVPTLSIPHHGRVPRKPRVFSVEMRCTGNASGITTFGIGLSLHTQQGQPLTGTPLRLQLRKECSYMGPDPECNEKCDNGGVCDEGQRCVCAEGYLGPYCSAALCYPRCMNGGTCTSPGRCSCPPGFNGRHCEGGICQHKCQNGGKCIQKDTCECRRGYYGNQCEFSKCVIPCVNGGRCRDVNKCRCPHGFSGDHCEVILSPQPIPPTAGSTLARCHRRCRHGSCLHSSACHCHQGYTGRWCRRRSGRGSGRQKKKVWV